MRTNLFRFSILCLTVMLISSCNQEGLLNEMDNISVQGTLVADTVNCKAKNNSIIPLKEEDFPKIEKVKLRSAAQNATWEDLYQLNGIEFYIQSKDTYFGKNTLETTGKSSELKLAEYSLLNQAQLFYIKFLPASTGIPYLIYSYKEQVPIGVGQYPNNPKYVLYAKDSDSGSLFGFSWDFYANAKSYFIENQDVIGGGSSMWDIYYHSITANNGMIDLLKTSYSRNQEFTIVPNDEFTIESLDFDLETARITSSEPVSIKKFVIESASMPITKKLTVNETKTEETTFQESSSTTIKKSGSVNVGISIKIVNIGGSQSFEKSDTQTVTYGDKSSITRTISDETSVTIPANTRGEIDYQSIKHTLDVNYKIVFKGVRYPKLIEMRGTWKGVDYTTDHFIVKEYQLNTNVLKNARVLKSSVNE